MSAARRWRFVHLAVLRPLLTVTALVSLAWAALLLALKDRVIAAEQLSPLARALANGLGIANLVLACIFWLAARAWLGSLRLR